MGIENVKERLNEIIGDNMKALDYLDGRHEGDQIMLISGKIEAYQNCLQLIEVYVPSNQSKEVDC